MNAFDALVVGGGVAGLSCAASLAEAGMRVCVLEALAIAGGRARSWSDSTSGLDVDIGPHVISSEHRNFLRLLERLGTAGDICWQRDTMVDLLDAGEVLSIANVRWTPPFHSLPNLPVALRRLSLRDAMSHARLAWHAARENEQSLRLLDTRDARSYLCRIGVSDRAIDWFWRSAMLALLNLPLEHCSAASVMRIFRLMLGRSGYHFGFQRVGLSSLYVPGCTAAIRKHGGHVVTGTAVRSLQLAGEAVSGVRLRDGSLLHATTCVLALPPWHLAPLLARTGAPALVGLHGVAGQFAGAPYQCTYLWLDQRVTRQRFWARVWNPDDLNTDFYDLANIRPDLAAGNSLIACNAIGPNVRPDWSDAQVIARTLEELVEFAPQAREARVLHARVHRIRGAIPQARPGTETLRPPNATAVRGLLLAGDWTDTAIPCSMESAARSAALAADAVLGGSRALPAPETYGLPALLRRKERQT